MEDLNGVNLNIRWVMKPFINQLSLHDNQKFNELYSSPAVLSHRLSAPTIQIFCGELLYFSTIQGVAIRVYQQWNTFHILKSLEQYVNTFTIGSKTFLLTFQQICKIFL